MKTIAISDIHGCYNELKELLNALETNGLYDKNVDKLIFLGDYIDRGSDSRLVIEFIRNLQKNNNNVIALKGNHEDMLLEYVKGIGHNWLCNGCGTTLDSYKGYEEQYVDDIRWMSKLPLYHEDEHFVYVHAGIDVNKPMDKQDKNTLLWVRDPFLNSRKQYHKTVVFGHTPTLYLNNDDKPVYTFAKNIDIDTGCVYGGALSALIIENDEVLKFYQVKSLNNKRKKTNV